MITKPETLQEELNLLWKVQRCWNDSSFAKDCRMTFGTSVGILRTLLQSSSVVMRTRAQVLLDDISKNAAAPQQRMTK